MSSFVEIVFVTWILNLRLIFVIRPLNLEINNHYIVRKLVTQPNNTPKTWTGSI